MTATPTHTPTDARADARDNTPSEAPQSAEGTAARVTRVPRPRSGTAPAEPCPAAPGAGESSSRWASPSPC